MLQAIWCGMTHLSCRVAIYFDTTGSQFSSENSAGTTCCPIDCVKRMFGEHRPAERHVISKKGVLSLKYSLLCAKRKEPKERKCFRVSAGERKITVAANHPHIGIGERQEQSGQPAAFWDYIAV